MVLIGAYDDEKAKKSWYSFRPLAGIMVLIGMILYAYCKEQLRFRPLAGIMVLIIFDRGLYILQKM